MRVFSDIAKVILNGLSTCFLHVDLKVTVNSKHVTVIKNKKLNWFEENGVKKTKTIVLYKRVSVDFKTQEGEKNETVWKVGSSLTHPNWQPKDNECGEGKFHACSKPYFCDEFRDKKDDRYIAIRINKEDLYVWPDPQYPHKIAFRKGKVLFEVDKWGNKK